MPYETGITPFTGDNDIADFMANVWLPFARDDCKWADNQAPSPNGIGTTSNEVWTHRVARSGSPTAVSSPYTPKPPYVFFKTQNNHLAICTGTGVDVASVWHDQPGQPSNWFDFSAIVDDGSGLSYVGQADIGCPWINDIIGTFQKYWMFSDELGRYVHCVIQVGAREYRHFHVGLFNPLHPDVSEDSFYVTGHFWDSLYSRYTSDVNETDNQNEHNPYSSRHRLPFAPNSEGETTFFLPRAEFKGARHYIPGLDPNWDWYIPVNSSKRYTGESGSGSGLSKDTANPLSPAQSPALNHKYTDYWPSGAMGYSQVSGYGNGMGRLLFSADRTYTSNTNSLIPIYVSVAATFSGLTRQGVVCQVPDIYRINIRDYSPGEEITVGTDTYVVFPLINKDAANILDGEGYSGYEGLAYKKITTTVP